MKRLDIIVRNEKTNSVVQAIKKIGVGGLTVLQVQGQGAEEDPLVGSYYTRGMILTVVENDKVDKILEAVKNAACTKQKGDGKVFVSDVDEVMDLATGECGHKIL